jgi:hypothetical protein
VFDDRVTVPRLRADRGQEQQVEMPEERVPRHT